MMQMLVMTTEVLTTDMSQIRRVLVHTQSLTAACTAHTHTDIHTHTHIDTLTHAHIDTRMGKKADRADRHWHTHPVATW